MKQNEMTILNLQSEKNKLTKKLVQLRYRLNDTKIKHHLDATMSNNWWITRLAILEIASVLATFYMNRIEDWTQKQIETINIFSTKQKKKLIKFYHYLEKLQKEVGTRILSNRVVGCKQLILWYALKKTLQSGLINLNIYNQIGFLHKNMYLTINYNNSIEDTNINDEQIFMLKKMHTKKCNVLQQGEPLCMCAFKNCRLKNI
ncbi:hypothetical protein RFI_05884 [Reticulomyxa filosa]|uniref:Uncharacterized protein n=1 Tax=Reticulomyxa filosa TaxID=46433 RepID=X6NY35_RETFI|nr:hypothetical protein RFI_05884 [Reticulomyxa filosa]|eukprot:ETO31235.1 hypothetical protein RFI_05884 [Reticulomyxa filosa]